MVEVVVVVVDIVLFEGVVVANESVLVVLVVLIVVVVLVVVVTVVVVLVDIVSVERVGGA